MSERTFLCGCVISDNPRIVNDEPVCAVHHMPEYGFRTRQERKSMRGTPVTVNRIYLRDRRDMRDPQEVGQAILDDPPY